MDKPDMNPKMGMDMMKKMMGGGDSESGRPMQMCKDMMSSVKKTASMAAFATPELQTLFGEWLEGKEKDVLKTIAKSGKHDLANVAKKLKLTTESTAYLLARLATEEKLTLEVKANSKASKAVVKKKAKKPAKAPVKKKAVKKKAASKKKVTKKTRT